MTMNQQPDNYYELHRCCPNCGGGDIGHTTSGSIQLPWFPEWRDTNEASCLCHWRGIIHDLVPAPPPPPSIELVETGFDSLPKT